jgi:hypothetical protein
VSINTVQVYLQSVIDGLPVPNNLSIQAFITPPNPEVDYTEPHAYIWPAEGQESRTPGLGGTIPRASSPGAFSGTKSISHTIDIFLVWFAANDDPDADTWFPGMVDAIMNLLRVVPTPATVQDPYTNMTTTLIDVGERMTYRIAVSAVADEAFNRYDALITVHILELFPS